MDVLNSSPKEWLSQMGPVGWLRTDPFPKGFLFITGDFVPFLISGALYLVIVLSLIFLIIGGIGWITSRGDKEGLAKAKATITYAVVGLALGLGSFIIIGVLSYFLGANLTGTSCLAADPRDCR